jgi:hypothetical protein
MLVGVELGFEFTLFSFPRHKLCSREGKKLAKGTLVKFIAGKPEKAIIDMRLVFLSIPRLAYTCSSIPRF